MKAGTKKPVNHTGKSLILFSMILLFTFAGSSAQAMENILLAQADIPDTNSDLVEVQDSPEQVDLSVVMPELTLKEAIESALECNRNLLMAQQAIDITRAAGQTSLVGMLPDLSMVYSYTRNHKATDMGSEDDFFTGLMFRYPIYHSGERSANRRAAEAGVEISQLDYDIAYAMIAYAATDAYCTAREGFGGLAVRQASYEHLTELERQAQAMYDAGYMPLSDLLAVQVAKSQAEVQVHEWTNNVQTRQTTLAITMGIDASSRWTLVPIDYPIVEIPFSFETLYGWALEQRPELKQLQAEREKLLAQMDAIRASEGPNIDFNAEYTSRASEFGFSDSSNDLSGGISIWWDLYNFGRTDDLLAPLEEQLELLDIQEEQLEEQIYSEVELALLSVNTQFENVRVTTQAVLQAEEALRVSTRRMEEGLGLMVEVLDAQATWTQLGAGSVYATHGYYRTLAALSGSVGVHILDLIALIEAAGENEQ